MDQIFTTALMGSLPRSSRLLEAKEQKTVGSLSAQGYQDILFNETRRMVAIQEEAGIDVITSGELDRDNYISYVAAKVDGIEIMTNDELLDYSSEEFRKSYEKSLKERDAKDAGINNPIAVGKIDTQAQLNFEEIHMLEALTDKPLKATLPSPYLLTRSLWLTGVSDQVYANREALGKDIRELILNEVKRLIDRGVRVIQLDDPVLSQIVFTDEEDQTFY
ncbi:hypothetical protein QP860_05075 [Aerococcus sp. UMB1112A]|uniref:hypothetical protein n=1 Tax=Aerococcus sp. UMB1112A TaxID=3050609 RepID=UPI0025502971|nr:hypothetical protein [Aerococcus sp. UMB1112A]MDK8502426.1 hypothetical protein [Aerococcus sp. UMB1112A]